MDKEVVSELVNALENLITVIKRNKIGVINGMTQREQKEILDALHQANVAACKIEKA